MNGTPTYLIMVGFIVGALLLPVLSRIVMAMAVTVEDEEAVIVTVFGRHALTLDKPGLHWLPSRLLPWVAIRRVSLRRDFVHLQNVHVNDASGTTTIVDLWVEFAIAEPAKVIFEVEDWERSLQNVVAHAATSILGNREFREILCDRVELGALLREEVRDETDRWGLNVELVLIRNVGLLPEVAQHLFATVAARLERVKADIEESGRLSVAELDASTSAKVAELEARAKAEYPLAVGRALAELRKDPEIFEAYSTLYRLSQLRPHRAVAFLGFSDKLRAEDAAMFVPPAVGAGERQPDGGAARTRAGD
jgi:regulator of protease activity HflC (stomatin/prohibitin superfamily)